MSNVHHFLFLLYLPNHYYILIKLKYLYFLHNIFHPTMFGLDNPTILGDPSKQPVLFVFFCGDDGLRRLERHHMRLNMFHKTTFCYSRAGVGNTRPLTTCL